jgi:transposase, IS30 family
MKTYKHLSNNERFLIYKFIQEKETITNIAKHLNRDKGTISREISKNGTSAIYLPDTAGIIAKERRKLCHPKSKMSSESLRKYVLLKLEKGWSPELIEGRLRKRFNKTIINHETIYKFIYESELGQQHKLYEYLRNGKKRRTKQKGRRTKKSIIPNRIWIDERSEEANNRTSFGHFETDSVHYPDKYAVNTTTDRMSRFVMFTKLKGRDALSTSFALIDRLKGLPVKSITTDNGVENSKHEIVTEFLNVPFYFCHPYHSWEKGSVEQINGLLRRYLPRKTDLKKISQQDLDDIAFELNNRPRKCLGYKTPYEVLLEQGVALRN